MGDTGWIKLHRQIMENELYFIDRFSKTHAWIDLLLLANHKPRTILIRGVEIQLNIGELAYSVQSLSKRWQWNKRTLMKFLNWLENRQMIHTKTTNVTTVITILRYDDYQRSAHQSAHRQELRELKEENTTTNRSKISFDPETSKFINLDGNIERWQLAYKSIDVLSEFPKMECWLKANPKRSKTNWERFIVNWLSRTHEKALGGNGNGKHVPQRHTVSRKEKTQSL